MVSDTRIVGTRHALSLLATNTPIYFINFITKKTAQLFCAAFVCFICVNSCNSWLFTWIYSELLTWRKIDCRNFLQTFLTFRPHSPTSYTCLPRVALTLTRGYLRGTPCGVLQCGMYGGLQFMIIPFPNYLKEKFRRGHNYTFSFLPSKITKSDNIFL